ncbi:ATP-binding protein, partial [Ruminococcus sp.]
NGSVSISNPVHSGDISAERLFERTYRGDKARGGGGAGLGLYIVRLLAEKQGGEVSADVSGNMLTITIKFRT